MSDRYWHTVDDFRVERSGLDGFPFLLTRRAAAGRDGREVVAAFVNEDDAITAAQALDESDNPAAYNDE